MMIICILSQAAQAAGQKPHKILAGADIAQMLHGTATLQFGYGFACNWSAEAGISINFMQMRPSSQSEEDIHDSVFGDIRDSRGSQDYCKGTLAIRYWPSGTFRKAFIGIGAVFEEKGTADMMLSAGYTFSIWKNLMLTASYGICLREELQKNQSGIPGISLCISYHF